MKARQKKMGQSVAKILTIEDSAFERKVIIDLLRESGYEDIVEAKTGEEGLEVYEREKPDLVLLDLRMPGMQGMEVLKALKKKDAKVIVVSIVRKQETVDDVMRLGADGYLFKPVTKDNLIPPIKKVLGE